MRTMLGLALVVAGLIACTPRLQADDRSDALALVDEAIKAHGGADALTKAQSYTRKGIGTAHVADKELSITSEQTVNLPDRSRLAIDIDKVGRFIAVLNGDKGWETDGGPAAAMTEQRVKEIGDEAYILWLATLTPAKKDGVTLKPLKEMKVNDKPAVGVSVTAKGRPDAKLYFDKESHLLVKIEREAVQAGVKIDKEYLFGDYKDVDGVKLPGKMTEIVNGKKFSEMGSLAYKLHKPDDATFNKP